MALFNSGGELNRAPIIGDMSEQLSAFGACASKLR